METLMKSPQSTLDKSSPSLEKLLQSVCQRIPPLWPLTSFVAVNPFVGLSSHPFFDASRLMQRVGHGDILMPSDYYRAQLKGGSVLEEDLHAATALLETSWPAAQSGPPTIPDLQALERLLSSPGEEVAPVRVLAFSDFLEKRGKGSWTAFVVEEMSKWCSAYFDQGQSSWRMPWQEASLWEAWKAAAQKDANPELNGLTQFRAFVSTLPDCPLTLITQLLQELSVPASSQADFLHRQLMSLPGWSSYARYRARQAGLTSLNNDPLVQLLAIRLVYDVGLLRMFNSDPLLLVTWEQHVTAVDSKDPAPTAREWARYVAQQSLECAYQRELMTKLRHQTKADPQSGRRLLQAVFCIDVRSEVYRRALEAQDDRIATIGFAGFFGVAIEYQKFGEAAGSARCPVLLSPKIKVREGLQPVDGTTELRLKRRIHFNRGLNDAWNSLKTSAISCFSFVETAGLWFGFKLAMDSASLPALSTPGQSRGGALRFGPVIERECRSASADGPGGDTGIAPEDQIALAAGALTNMGLTRDFAKVVLLCGHGSATANNPYGSSLDCGACGGHAGDANARIAAALLNQTAVRAGLRMKGIHIPSDTVFIAGLHNTTTDEVRLFDDGAVGAKHPEALNLIQGWLSAASQRSRQERASSLGLAEVPREQLGAAIFQRSRDWAQVRPEWGLAGNAAFIAAPRERTRGLNLSGRTFLHDYHADQDLEKATLELIMIAPMIVASWINLQYYGSTVNNRLFGSGNKALHNVVGTFGVWQGNGGDLQSGLPMQSIHDGHAWRHEPLRLSVFIESDPDAIANVLAKHPDVAELINNGWISLFAMDLSAKKFWRYCAKQFVALNP